LLIKAIEEEIERVEHHLFNVLGMDKKKVEEMYKLIDIELEKRLKEQFDNFAEMK
jgi:Mn-dependent DtxR family transcriptional regulator